MPLLLRRLAPLTVLCAALFASPAGAAQTLGDLTPHGNACPTGFLIVPTSAPYVAPTAGVITQLTVQGGSAAGGSATPKVARRLAAGSYKVLGGGTAHTFGAGYDTSAQNVRVPVQAGDLIGLYVTTGYNCGQPSAASDQYAVANIAEPADGATVTLTESTSGRFSIAGRLEADADGDGYGDETQDACPADPARQAAPCTADVGIALSATPDTIAVGDVAVLGATVSTPGGSAAEGVNVAVALPPGLQVVGTFPTSCALTPSISCVLGSLGAGQSRDVAVVVRGTAAGARAATATVASANDPAAANNTATATLTVRRAPAADRCVVPRLKGRTLAFARELLKAARCALGRRTTRRVRRGRAGVVVAQRVKAGRALPVGSKVAVTVSRR